MQLIFEAPTKDSPGFLKRLKKAMAFQAAINSQKVDEKTIDDLVDFLAAYIKNETPENAKEILLDASEAQFMEMLQSITGQDNDTKKNENGSSSALKEQAQKHHQ